MPKSASERASVLLKVRKFTASIRRSKKKSTLVSLLCKAASVVDEPVPETRRRTRSFVKELESTLDGRYWSVSEGRDTRRSRKQTVLYGPC